MIGLRCSEVLVSLQVDLIFPSEFLCDIRKGDIRPAFRVQELTEIAYYRDTKQVRDKYNKSYLRAEYNYARRAAESSAKWEDAKAGKDSYDLMYRTAGDSKVRPEHAALDGIVLPVDDPFWDEGYPPNGWNCRCTTLKVPKGTHPTDNSDRCLKTFREMTTGRDEMWRCNTARQGVIFPRKHPYYSKRGIDHCNTPKLAADLGKDEECKVLNAINQARPQRLTDEQKALRDQLKQKLKEKFKGTFAKPQGCPEDVLITSASIEETVNQPFNNFQGKLKAIEELDDFINRSKWLGKLKPRDKDRHVSFISQTEIDGEKCYFVFVKHKGTPIKFHSVSDGDLAKFLEKT